jgi:nucleoside-diphosphate-sugar epimerase
MEGERLMDVFVIGAAGGVGRRLGAILAERGDRVSGLHRKAEQAETVAASGATAIAGDLIADSIEELAEKIAGHDAVVFSAGAHGTGKDQTSLIDGKGLEKAADAAIQAGVSRFVLVSAFRDSARTAGLGEGFAHYLWVKKQAEIYLTRTSLNWIILRPGHLLDEPGDGLVTAGLAVEDRDIRRDNLAEFIATALHEPALSRTIVEITDGHTPIAEAVSTVARSVGPRH